MNDREYLEALINHSLSGVFDRQLLAISSRKTRSRVAV